MRSRRFLPALILTIALCLASCSATRIRTREIRAWQEEKALAEETARIREDLLSIREEIRILTTNASRRSERTDSEAVETVTEQFDTSGRLIARTTERRDNRSKSTVDETQQSQALTLSDSLDAVRAELAGKSLETKESASESEDLREEEIQAKEGLSWWQKALMYCGGAALLWVAFRLFKPLLKGV